MGAPSGNFKALQSPTATNANYYIIDANNSVIDLVNHTGTTTATWAYDPYGNLTQTPTGPTAAANRFLYNSGYYTNGLYHYGARYYDPSVGRWTQLDPSGQNPGLRVRRRQPHQQERPKRPRRRLRDRKHL